VEIIILEKKNQIPSLADLALQYGTIEKKQFDQLNQLYAQKQRDNNAVDMGQLMMGLKFATGYQIGLLKLIHEYLIIKKRGEAFGKIAIEKGFASQEDVDRALDHQKKEFKRAKIKKLIGDILVESRVITVKQKNYVLKEQVFVDTQAEKIFKEDALPPDTKAPMPPREVALTEYETQFLQVKALDQEFAASIVEKQLASEREVQIAKKVQEEAFVKESQIRILGDIMVDLSYITPDQKDQILKEQERIDALTSPAKNKNRLNISISSDHMEAVVTIKDDVENIQLSDLKNALESREIKYGIYPDAILQCNLDMGNTRFIAARQDFGLELVKQRKTTYSFNTQKLATEEKKKGATLAEQTLGTTSHLKKDLFGNHVEQSGGWDHSLRCGVGTRLSKDKTKAFAGKTGFPSLSVEHKLYIHPTINVLEDADLRYGPLEKYANLSVSGVLTGAYPVTAGNIKAREIRGADITAIGDVESQVGITDAVIVAQGDIRARYLHNCRIETFGNVYIENEMIDCEIYCSGKIDSGNCHIISTTLYGKKGVEIAGAGSGKTNACTIGAGSEHHILERIRQIDFEIQQVRLELDELQEKQDEQIFFSKKAFQKMIDLKIFHDRAKKKKEKLTTDFKKKKNSYKKNKLKNIVKLIHNFEKRKASSLSALKELNGIKKKYDAESARLKKRIEKLKPKIKRDTRDFQIDIITFFEWARKQENICQIKISNLAFQGTMLRGIFSSVTLDENKTDITAFEKQISENSFQLTVQKN